MIRLASHKDTMIIIGLLRSFLGETSYKQAQRATENLEHLCKLVWTVQQHGYIWLAYINERPVGLLMAIKEPNMWVPEAKELREIVWYVLPEYRKSSIGGKLFLTYCELGNDLLHSKLIDGYFTTRMPTTDSIDLERRGFRLTEQTYLKEL